MFLQPLTGILGIILGISLKLTFLIARMAKRPEIRKIPSVRNILSLMQHVHIFTVGNRSFLQVNKPAIAAPATPSPANMRVV